MSAYHASIRALAACSALALLAGCESAPVKVVAESTGSTSKLGPAKGSACGGLGLAGTATNFVPLALNGRVQRAYDRALASVPGATSLIDVTLQENWYWIVVGTLRCVTINGEAVK